jgi:hypothetical protein
LIYSVVGTRRADSKDLTQFLHRWREALGIDEPTYRFERFPLQRRYFVRFRFAHGISGSVEKHVGILRQQTPII